MNQRILDLAVKSGHIVGELPLNANEKIQLAGLEKFVELVVLESVAEAKDDCAGWTERDQCLVMQVMDRIKVHFGVKE
jgi:hypothetical protein